MTREFQTVPACVGIIMDGNRRFARERGLALMEGHRLGYRKAKEVAGWCRDAGIKYLILYAFSTENWNRSPEEVSYLVGLFKKLLLPEADELRRKGGAIRCIGDIDRFGEDLAREVRRIEESNPANPTMTVVIALSYGGRSEILRAVNQLLAEKNPGPATEQTFEQHLYTAGIPDPDLIIRTSGEQRLSNFLPWQGIYSELFFTPTFWPAFSKEEFFDILKAYGVREKRRGR